MRRSVWPPLVAAFVCTCLVFLTQGWNSDAIVPEFVLRDLLRGTSLSGWHFAVDLLFFPDWPVWFAIRAFVWNFDFALFVYEFLLFAALTLFLREIFGATRAGLAICLYTAIWLLIFSAEWRSFVLPAHHGTALVVGLWWALVYVRSERLTFSKSIALASVAALTAASDPLFGIWFLIPAGLFSTVLVLTRRSSWRELFVRAGLGLAIVVLTIGIHHAFLALTGAAVGAAGDGIKFSFDSVKLISSYFVGFKFKLIFILLGCGLLFRRPFDPLRCFFASSVLATFAIVAGLNLWIDSSNVRYLSPVAVFVCFELTEFVLRLKERNARRLAAVFVLVAGCNLAVRFTHESYETVFTNRASARCVERTLQERGLVNESGLASYWAYKMTLAYAEAPLRLRQVDGGMGSYDWLVNRAWMNSSDQAAAYVLVTPREVADFASRMTDVESVFCRNDVVLIPKPDSKR